LGRVSSPPSDASAMPPLCNSQDIFLKDVRLPGSKRTERNGGHDRGRDDWDDRGGGMRSRFDRSRSPPASRGYGKGGYGYGKGKDDLGKGGKGGYWVFVDSGSKGKSDWEKGDRKGKSRDPYSSFGSRDYKGKSKGKDYEKGKGKRGGKRGGEGDVSSKTLDDSLEAYFGRKASAKPEGKEKAGAANDKDLDDQLSKYMGGDDKKAEDPKAEKEVKEDAKKDAGDKPEEKPAEDKAEDKKKEADAAEGAGKESK